MKGCLGCAGVIVAIFVVLIVIAAMNPSSFKSGMQEGMRESQPRHEHVATAAEQKRAFIATIDRSVTGARIAGNPFKFVGKRVALSCTVDNIPDDSDFNGGCGTEDDPENVVIETDTKGLEKGQHVRVYGTVEQPMAGTNAMGGSMNFPTVKAEFME